MCTLTFIPTGQNGFIVTNNRDEAPGRETIGPKTYTKNKVKSTYPKDKVAGGTWLGTSDKNRLVCLLNGGFTAHRPTGNYRLSRGIVVTNTLVADNALSSISSFDFSGVEPFTLVLIEWHPTIVVHQVVWDGASAHISAKENLPHIWSSSLLYSAKAKQRREQWFSSFLNYNQSPSAEKTLQFHKTAGDGNPKTDLVMDRGFVKTKSISQIILKGGKTKFNYLKM
ncbi:MAG: NRDE family protein [Marinirhabdus sp.]